MWQDNHANLWWENTKFRNLQLNLLVVNGIHKIWHILLFDSYSVSILRTWTSIYCWPYEAWLLWFLKSCHQLLQQLPMSALANRFPASYKQSDHIQNIFNTFTLPEFCVRENSSNWKLLVTAVSTHCTDYADTRLAFSWKHVTGHLLWFRHVNPDCEMPFVSLMTQSTVNLFRL